MTRLHRLRTAALLGATWRVVEALDENRTRNEDVWVTDDGSETLVKPVLPSQDHCARLKRLDGGCVGNGALCGRNF